MTSNDEEYSVEQEMATFFTKTTTSRSECDQRAKTLVGGEVALIPVQGVCSYTVFAGPDSSSVVQFRLKSLALPLEVVQLARTVYGSLAPTVSFEGQIGQDEGNKEALYVYVMPRMNGISQLDFILAQTLPNDASEVCATRLTLVNDIACFFARSWKSPQKLDQDRVQELHHSYEQDLQALLGALPDRFHPSVRRCIQELSSIMALPMVLTHKDFGYANLLVDPQTSHLLGVIDWAESTIEPFGINFGSIERITMRFHMRNGHIRHVDHDVLLESFWKTLSSECGGLEADTLQTIRSAMILGLLLSNGFTPRLANMPKPRPILDDESGAYNMLYLDGLLVNPQTKMF